MSQIKKETDKQKIPIEEQQVLELLKINYDISAQSMQRLFLGADANAFTYKIDTKSESYFVKIKFGNHEDVHLSILCLLHDAEINEIIFPITTIDGKLLKRQDNFKMIVYPFVGGQNGFEKKLSKTQWIEFGKTLKKIHTLSVPTDLQQQLRKETFSAKWREIVRSLYPVIESQVSDDEISKDLKKFFKLNSDAIHRLVNTADELSKKVQSDLNQYVLCHSDIHAGNVLITSDNSFYIVDWDDPMMAPKERDLMFIGGGVGNVWNLSQEEAYFYEGYGDVNINETLLSYYRHERIVVDIAEFCQDILSDNHSNQSRLGMLNHFKSMFEPNGVVEIAFNMKLRRN